MSAGYITTAPPRWEPTPASDLLKLVADSGGVIGRDAVELFLSACQADADSHGGFVSVNRVRERLRHAQLDPRRYSAMWAAFTGRGKPMIKVGGWETCRGSTSGNDGRPFPLRRWVGVPEGAGDR